MHPLQQSNLIPKVGISLSLGLTFLLGGFFEGSLCSGLAALDLVFRIHCAPAALGAAIADCFVVAAVIETVVVGDLFAGLDGFDGLDPDSPVLFTGFAVGGATVVDKHRCAVTVDDDLTISQSKEIGDGRFLIVGVGFFFAYAAPGILGDASAFAEVGGGIAAGGVNGGGANDETHTNVRCFL
jgi:hypothetical protein